LLLLLLLLWRLVFDMCSISARGLVEEFVEGVKAAGAGSPWSNIFLERFAGACLDNIVEDFFVLL
jgi:hypothetical protein